MRLVDIYTDLVPRYTLAMMLVDIYTDLGPRYTGYEAG
jgi:hypothetical protein